MTKNPDPDKHSYYGYGTGFDIGGLFSYSDGSRLGKNVMIFGVGNISFAHSDNRKKDILILGNVQQIGYITITAESGYSIDFSDQLSKTYFGSLMM